MWIAHFPKFINPLKLTPYYILNLRFATQVLSSSVSKVLSEYGPPEVAPTTAFCSLMDNLFVIVNVRNTTEHFHKGKTFLAPFRSINDPRSSWLRNVFLKYFTDCSDSIEQRPGNFNRTAWKHVCLLANI